MPATTTTDPSDIALMAESFALHLNAEHKAPRTVAIYSEAIARLERFLRETGMPTGVDRIKAEHVEAFMASLQGKVGPATANQVFRSLVQFWKWCLVQRETKTNPMANLHAPRVPRTMKATIRQPDVETLITSIKGNTFLAKRDRAMLLLLWDSGVRRAELTSITMSRLDVKERQVIVTGKGGGERAVPFGDRAAVALDDYVRARRRWTDERIRKGSRKYATIDQLFIGEKGALTNAGVTLLIRRRMAAAGLTTAFSAHTFRRGWTHQMLMNGAPENVIRSIAGWTTRTMLDVYGYATETERAHAVFPAYSPADRLTR